MRVRGFLPKDAEEIVRLHGKSSEWFEEVDITREFILESSRRHDFRFFIATIGDEVVGFCGVLFYQKVGRAEIGPIGIDDEYRGKGIGSDLLDSVIGFLKEVGVHRVMAKVKMNNETAINFFKSKKFEPEATLRNYTKRGETIVQMVRFL